MYNNPAVGYRILYKKIFKNLSLIILLIVAGYFLDLTVTRLENISLNRKIETKSIPLSPELYKAVSGGFTNIIADLIWFEIIQNDDEKKLTGQGKSWFFYKLNSVINLDPDFRPPYEFAALVVGIIKEDYEGAEIIVQKAIEKFPLEWKFPFVLGYNYIYEQPDLYKAAQYFRLAAEKPNAPQHLVLLATRLAARTGSYDFAIDALVNLRNNAKDDKQKAQFEIKIRQIYIEKTWAGLENYLNEYKEKHKKNPKDIGALLKYFKLEINLNDPLGGTFFVDNNGKISNTKNPRLKVGGYDKNK